MKSLVAFLLLVFTIEAHAEVAFIYSVSGRDGKPVKIDVSIKSGSQVIDSGNKELQCFITRERANGEMMSISCTRDEMTFAVASITCKDDKTDSQVADLQVMYRKIPKSKDVTKTKIVIGCVAL